jgi:hypothetical protein
MSTAAAEMLAELVEWLRSYGSSLAMCRLRPELGTMMNGMQKIYGFRIFANKEAAIKTRW